MKKKIIFLTLVSLFLAAAVSAQTSRPNFSGEWQLDVGKSKLSDTMQIESMMLSVGQTEKDLRIGSLTKMSKNSTRGASRSAALNAVYSLEGKEMLADIGGGIMGKETRRATMTTDGKLNLTVTRIFKNETRNVPMKTNEIWELLDDGETLKITRYMETASGATNAEMYFTRKPSGGLKTEIGTYKGSANGTPTETVRVETSGKSSGGVLNGKALKLPRPEYPAAARAVKASGAVNVQVTIDEQGNIISASAVSGHPLLRQAAEQAAREAQFAPTLLEGVPVKVTGVIVYNFVP